MSVIRDSVGKGIARATAKDPVSNDLGAIVVKDRGARVLASIMIDHELRTEVVGMEIRSGVIVETTQPIQTPSTGIAQTVEIGTRWGAGPEAGV